MDQIILHLVSDNGHCSMKIVKLLQLLVERHPMQFVYYESAINEIIECAFQLDPSVSFHIFQSLAPLTMNQNQPFYDKMMMMLRKGSIQKYPSIIPEKLVFGKSL